MHWYTVKGKHKLTKSELSWLGNAISKNKSGQALQPIKLYQQWNNEAISIHMRAELDQGGTITAQDCMKICWRVMAKMWSNKAEEFVAEIIDDASWQKDGDKVKVKDVPGDDEWKTPEEYHK